MPRALQDFGPLDPASLGTVILTFDFSAMLATGETISTAIWSIASLFGVDSSPLSRLIGVTSISGNLVLQEVGTAVANETYRMSVTITTSDGQTLTLYADCPCQSPS